MDFTLVQIILQIKFISCIKGNDFKGSGLIKIYKTKDPEIEGGYA